MFSEKYRPKSLAEVLSQKELILNINSWLDSWKPGAKALMIFGPTGTGKSMIVELIAKEKGMNVFEIGTDEKRSASAINEKMVPASKESSLKGKRLIVIDDVDSFSSSDRGGIAEVIKVVKESLNPVILIAKDAYDQKLRALRAYCELLKTRKVQVNTIEKRLREIALLEKIKIDDGQWIRKVAENSLGDMRSALNDLETLNENAARDKESNIFDVMHSVFRSRNIRKASQSIDSSDKDMDEIFWWIEQNIPLEYQGKGMIAQAFECLSLADIFRGRIMRNQNYRFRKYMKDMMASISLIENPQKRFVMYRPPGRFITLGATKVSRKETEEFYKGLNLGCSMKKAKEQAPYLKMILGRNFKE
ncbi:MAG: AAA family ATPase [Candidatus Aenigmatarchaeota archaeon]